MKPKISVIMSVYNSAEFLDESINSILQQTLTDLEFIIVDDKSTDASGNIIAKYAASDNRIVYLGNPENIGLTKSLNKALAVAKGKYIARQDADDISLPERLLAQYNHLESNPHIYLVGTNGFVRHSELGVYVRGVVRGTKKIKRILPHSNVFFHASIMFHNDGHLYRDKFYYSQDFDFYLCCLRQGKKLDNLDEPLVEYRISDDAISIRKSHQQALFAQKACEFYRQYMKCNDDQYDEFCPDDILSSAAEKNDLTYSGVKLFIDHMCYYNKRSVPGLLAKHRHSLNWLYLMKKIAVVLMPVAVLEYQHILRSRH